MKLYCALCGRPMEQAAVLIGNHPVGPKCAKRAGLIALAQRKGGLVFPVVRRHVERPRHPFTADLFDVKEPCAKCSHPFDQNALGPHGCPNCEGEGLQ